MGEESSGGSQKEKGDSQNPQASEVVYSTRCTVCGDPAVAVYYMDYGCQAFPGERTQSMCAQHECTVSPIGNIEMLLDYRIYDE